VNWELSVGELRGLDIVWEVARLEAELTEEVGV
jgi:hypothetical protein